MTSKEELAALRTEQLEIVSISLAITTAKGGSEWAKGA
jgi:hypothetical protein